MRARCSLRSHERPACGLRNQVPYFASEPLVAAFNEPTGEYGVRRIRAFAGTPPRGQRESPEGP